LHAAILTLFALRAGMSLALPALLESGEYAEPTSIMNKHK
jgi:hypothetical protein